MNAFVRHTMLSGEQAIFTWALLCNLQSVIKIKLHLAVDKKNILLLVSVWLIVLLIIHLLVCAQVFLPYT